MKEFVNNEVKIIKQGKKMSDDEKIENQKNSKNKTILQYIIPLVLTIIVALIYIPTHNNILLIPFGILMFVVLFGWDSSTRTCRNCKKWNSIMWIKSEKIRRKTNVKKRSVIRKDKMKQVTEKVIILRGKCKNCECEYELERNRIF